MVELQEALLQLLEVALVGALVVGLPLGDLEIRNTHAHVLNAPVGDLLGASAVVEQSHLPNLTGNAAFHDGGADLGVGLVSLADVLEVGVLVTGLEEVADRFFEGLLALVVDHVCGNVSVGMTEWGYVTY